MRIDFITTELRTGGAERCLTEVAIGLQQRDHRVRVISLAPLPEAGPRSALVERLKASRVPLESVNLKSIWQVPSAVRALTKFMSDDRPEIAQTFLYHANVLGTRAAVRAKVPVRVGAVRVAEHRRIRLAIERRATRQMAAIFCVSESVEAFVRNQLRPRQSCFVKTIPNGVDVDRFRNAVPVDWSRYGLAPGGEVVLVVGRLHPQKGLTG